MAKVVIKVVFLEAIINMAKLMGLRVIAEGIESSQQVELLFRFGHPICSRLLLYKPNE